MEPISTTLSTTPITRTEFDFVNENLVDRLKIIFFEGTQQLSEISFELHPIKKTSSQKYPDFTVFCNEISNRGVHKIADVYPLNGTVRKLKETDNPDGSFTSEPSEFKINNHFERKHREQILSNVIKLKSIDKCDFVRVMVIDFKDTTNSYINRNEIWKTEQAFADFFTGNPPDNKKESRGRLCTYTLIKDNLIKFVINEGTLKADLMANTFTPTQKKYFAKEGLELCQVCEIIMNGFKQGRELIVNDVKYHPKKYIRALCQTPLTKVIDCAALLMPKPYLLTYYPKKYEGTYSKTSKYFETIKKIYNKAEHFYDDENQITTIIIP